MTYPFGYRVFFALVTGFMYLVFIITSIILYLLSLLVCLATCLFDRRLRALHLLSCFWASIYTWVCPLWTISIEGRKYIRKDKAYVMVCNHQSMLDILVIYRLFRHFKWVSKEELFSVPFVGWTLTLNHSIRVKRSSVKSQRHMLDECVHTLLDGSSVMIFPEGTRSVTGELRSFKEGAFHVVREARADILPMVINGSSKALPNRGGMFRTFADISLRVLPPIPFQDVAHLSQKELSEYVRGIIGRELAVSMASATSVPKRPMRPSC